MADYPRVFKRFDRTLIKAADQTGNLDLCFRLLTQWYEFVIKLQRIIMTGMLLPLFVLNVAAFVVPLPSLLLQDDIGFLRYMREVVETLSAFYVPILVIVALVKLGPRVPRSALYPQIIACH
jgi:hypothetical protein